ncbi:MAG TPA: M64 family metallopeptidase [Dongiaceae bacterium]
MSASDGHVVGTAKIVDNGHGRDRWDLVILGDGYREPELPKYRADAQNFVDIFRATPPFNELFAAINVHRVDVVSKESGADDPGCAGGPVRTAKTYFDATYCTLFGGQRLDRLLTVNTSRALSVASAQVPLRNQVLCIVNAAKYGGSGGTVATCSTHPDAAKIAIHELGHSAFGLADEYGGDGTATPPGEPSKPNVTRDANRATNKWRNLIAATTPMPSSCSPGCAGSACVPPAAPPPPGAVGAYEGGMYSNCNIYRPLPRCYMRDNSAFCPVCAGVIRRTLQPFMPV